jgi:uncharacterized lipoprotein YmbA
MRSTTMSAMGLLALALLVGGCFSTSDDEKPEQFYRVTAKLAPGGDVSPLSIVLRPFNTDESLGREGVLYRTSDVDCGYWVTHRWIEPVAGMVRSAVQEGLGRSGRFSVVHLYENESLADVAVDAEIHFLGEVDRPDGWYGVLDVTFEATSATDGTLLWGQRLTIEEKAATKTVADVARALSRALTTATEKLAAGIAAGEKP